MKSSRIWCWIGFVVIVIYGFWNWYYCCSKAEPEYGDKHFVNVYVNGDCKMRTLSNGVIDPLFVFPNDFVVWNNTSSSGVNLDLPDGFFEEDSVVIPPYKRVILKVIMSTPAEGGVGAGDDCGSAMPKVKIGEDP